MYVYIFSKLGRELSDFESQASYLRMKLRKHVYYSKKQKQTNKKTGQVFLLPLKLFNTMLEGLTNVMKQK